VKVGCLSVETERDKRAKTKEWTKKSITFRKRAGNHDFSRRVGNGSITHLTLTDGKEKTYLALYEARKKTEENWEPDPPDKK